MKNLSRLLFAMLLVLGFSSTYAQDDNNPWALSFGVNAVDLYPVGEDAPQGDYFDEFFNAEDHWNILPSLSSITVSKYLSNGFSLGVSGSINRIEKIGQLENVPSLRVEKMNYYGLDGMVKYSFSELLNYKTIEPYLGVGGGYTWIDDIGAGTLNGSLGLNYWFTDNLGLTLQTSYKHAFEDYLSKHWQHYAGITVKFGGKDTDGDGIYDKDDECPEVPGLAEFNGCPDTDGDGIPDHLDECPTVPGLKALNGCPDSDGDGVADHLDECPNEAGPAANNGCPWPDSDGDGVPDKDDKCPNEPGTVANHGCPEVVAPTAEVMATLNNYARTILFSTGKSTFQDKTFPILQAMIAILKEYPESNFTIEGHTDSVGSANTNRLLSERRANAVKDYLIANGVNMERLTAVGFGEDYPIADNKTAAGRKNNRRVEVKLKK